MDVSQMQYLAKLLNVDELHFIDENGMIASASVREYIGMNMADYEQTRPFLAILESDDEEAYLIQDAQPNAAAGKIMQYIGVARRDKGGFVQVGFEPDRLMEAQSRNTIIFSQSSRPMSGRNFLWWTAGQGKSWDIPKPRRRISARSIISSRCCISAEAAHIRKGRTAGVCTS